MTKHLIFHDDYHASTEPLDGSKMNRNQVIFLRLWNYYPQDDVGCSDPTPLEEYERLGQDILSKDGEVRGSSIPGENAYIVFS